MRYLAVDPGGRRMGLAVGDDETGIASPYEVIPYDGVAATARYIAETAAHLEVGCVVLGLPTRMDGSRGGAARRTEKLAEALQGLEFEVALQSEFLSTDEARRRARAAGRPADRPVDDLAALVILEEFFAVAARSRGRGPGHR